MIGDQTGQKKKKSKNIIGILIIIFLLIINGYLVFNNIESKKEKNTISNELKSLEIKKLELELELNKTMVELNEFRGQTEELDSILNIANNELIEKQAYIQRLFRQNNADKSLIKKLLNEVRLTKEAYLAQIDVLIQENKELITENLILKENTQMLKKRNKYLEQKFAIGSVLKAINVDAKGYREKSEGSYKPSNNAKKVTRIEVCFDIEENKVLDNDKIEILLCIINPDGNILTTKSAGSGTFKLAESDKDMQYTKSISFDYKNAEKYVCMRWKRSQGFSYKEGVYYIKIFNNGYLIGSSEFELK